MERPSATLIPFTLAVQILVGCSNGDGGCLWNLSDLLKRAGARVNDNRVVCGVATDGDAAALDCFNSAPPGQGAELVVSHCVDCYDFTSLYSTPRSEIFALDRAASTALGGPPRRSRVTRCTSVVLGRSRTECVPDEELYSCREPASGWADEEMRPSP